jgi:hypothetical protein
MRQAACYAARGQKARPDAVLDNQEQSSTLLWRSSTTRCQKNPCMSHARRLRDAKGPLVQCLTTTIHQVQWGAVLDDCQSSSTGGWRCSTTAGEKKWLLCCARRRGARKAGCIQMLDDSESSNTEFGCQEQLEGRWCLTPSLVSQRYRSRTACEEPCTSYGRMGGRAAMMALRT